jgi:hypothetical protein
MESIASHTEVLSSCLVWLIVEGGEDTTGGGLVVTSLMG